MVRRAVGSGNFGRIGRGFGAVVALLWGATVVADEVRYVEQDGITYRETRRTCYRPVTETQCRETTTTVWRTEYATEMREIQRTVWQPVTEYQWESSWVGRWNPFVEPRLEWRLMPRTRWEQRTEIVRQPVVVARWAPETRSVSQPLTVTRYVPEEVITRVAVSGPGVGGAIVSAPAGGASGSSAGPVLAGPVPRPAPGVPIGGVARLDRDPPRTGVSTAWRASTSTR
mgnify:CR=1 FL=1